MQTLIFNLEVLGTDVHEFFSIEEEQTLYLKKKTFMLKKIQT
jgi:hypothetical protein